MKECVPYIIYADFESEFEPVQDEKKHALETVKRAQNSEIPQKQTKCA